MTEPNFKERSGKLRMKEFNNGVISHSARNIHPWGMNKYLIQQLL